jgi:hypothetical protein
MQITRNNLDTSPGPGDWSSGSVDDEYAQAPSLEDGDR